MKKESCCDVQVFKTEKGYSAEVEVKNETCCQSSAEKKEKKS